MTRRGEHMGLVTAAQLHSSRPGKKPSTEVTDAEAGPSQIGYAEDEKVRAAGARAVARWAGLLRRLSE